MSGVGGRGFLKVRGKFAKQRGRVGRTQYVYILTFCRGAVKGRHKGENKGRGGERLAFLKNRHQNHCFIRSEPEEKSRGKTIGEFSEEGRKWVYRNVQKDAPSRGS